MSCIKNKQAEKDFNDLSKLLNNQPAAGSIIASNNGYSLDFNKEGNHSLLYEQLLEHSTRDKALIAKALLYTKDFINEPTIVEFNSMFNNNLINEITNNYLIANGKNTVGIGNDVDYSIKGLDINIKAATIPGSKKEQFSNFTVFKKAQIKYLKIRKYSLAEQKIVADNANDTETYNNVSKELRRVSKTMESYEEDLAMLRDQSNFQNTIKNISRIALNDLTRIKSLMVNDNPQMYTEGKELLEWYSSLGNFEELIDHPLFKDNTIYNNLPENNDTEKTKKARYELMKSELKSVSDRAKIITDDFHKKTKSITYNKLVTHRNYDKVTEGLGSKITLQGLFETGEVDISIFSAWFRDPTKNFGSLFDSEYSNNWIAQLMVEEFEDKLKTKEQNIKKLHSRIDNLLLKLKLKDYDSFYQKDSDGKLLPYLVGKFTNEWNTLTDDLETNLQNDISEINRTGGNNYNLAHQRYYNDATKNGNFLNINKLSDLQQFDLEVNNGNNQSEFNLDDEYRNTLINDLGELEFNDMIESQKRLYIDYLEFISDYENKLLFMLNEGQIKSNKPDLQLKIMLAKARESHNPLILHSSKSGLITTDTRSTSVSGKYTKLYPKPENNQFLDNNFKSIESNPDMYELWKAMNESLRYINSVLVSTGGKSVVSNSLMDMGKTFTEHISMEGFMGTEMYSDLAKHVITKWRKNKQVNPLDLVSKDENQVNTSKVKSMQASIDVETRHRMLIFESGIKFAITHRNDKYKSLLDVNQTLMNKLRAMLDDTQYDLFTKHNMGSQVTLNVIKVLVRKQVSRELMEHQSLDLAKAIKQYLTHAANIDAKNEAIPMINQMQKLYAEVKDANGNTRKNAILKTEKWIKRAVKDQRGQSKILLTNEHFLTSTPDQKRKIKELEDALLIAKNGEAELQAAITKLKEPTNALFILNYFRQFIIFNSMAFNKLSGIFNRLHALFGNSYHDRLGEYWTSGNNIKSEQFMRRKQIKWIKDSLGKIYIGEGDIEMEKAVLFFNNANLHQDMRDEAQKASRKLGKEDYTKRMNPFYMSITAVEWKNQGQTILNVLQDFEIDGLNAAGEQIKTQVFDGKKFLIYDNVDLKGIKFGEKGLDGKKSKGGTLVLKKEYRTDENIANWETGIGKQQTAFTISAKSANVAVNGNYSDTLGMAIKDGDAGKGLLPYLMIFATFLPEYIGSRFDKGGKLSTGVVRKKSVYGAANSSIIALATTMLGILFGGPVGIGIGVAGLATIGTKFATGTMTKNVSILKEAYGTLQLLARTLINIPTRAIIGKEVVELDTKKYFGLHDKEGKSTVDQEREAKDIQAIMYEIAIAMTTILSSIATAKLLDCRSYDSEQECNKKKAVKTTLINLHSRFLNDIMMPVNPMAIIDFFLHGALLRTLKNTGEFLSETTKVIFGEDQVYKSGDNYGRSRMRKSGTKLLMPSIGKFFGVFDNNPDYKRPIIETLGLDNVIPIINRPILGQPAQSRRDYSDYWVSKNTLPNDEEEYTRSLSTYKSNIARMTSMLMNKGKSKKEATKLVKSSFSRPKKPKSMKK